MSPTTTQFRQHQYLDSPCLPQSRPRLPENLTRKPHAIPPLSIQNGGKGTQGVSPYLTQGSSLDAKLPHTSHFVPVLCEPMSSSYVDSAVYVCLVMHRQPPYCTVGSGSSRGRFVRGCLLFLVVRFEKGALLEDCFKPYYLIVCFNWNI